MKLSTFLPAFGAVALANATTVSVSYDNTYDNGAGEMTSVACSDGPNGLITKYGWTTFSQIPKFPHIGGSSTIPGWDAATCGQCFALTYKGKTIHVLAIDTAPSGMNIAEEAMNKLTNGQAEQLGRVTATIKKVGVSNCGLTPKRSIEFKA